MERVADIVNVEHVIVVQFSGRSYLGFVEINRRAAAAASASAIGRESRLRSFLNLPSLELRQCREDVEG